MNKHYYVGLEHHVRVLESAFEVQVVQGRTVLYVTSPRPLSEAELHGCLQSNPDLTPFYDQKWTKLTDQEHQSFLQARENGEEDRFLETLLTDASRIVAPKQYSNKNHKYHALIKESLSKRKNNKN